MEKADPGGTDGATEATGTTADTPTSGGTAISGEPATDSEPGSSATETEGGATVASATDSASGTETEGEEESDGTGDLPAACEVPDPDVDAAFSVALVGWPGQTDDAHDIDVTCTIDELAVEADTLVHALTCDDDGAPRQASLRVALTTAGSVLWSEGDSVRLESSRALELDFGIGDRVVKLWAADQRILLVGVEGGDPGALQYEPFTAEARFPCGVEDVDGEQDMPFELAIGFEESVVPVVHHQRAELPVGVGDVFAIDVGQATTNNCCHFTREHAVLIRRVTPL